MAKQTFTAGQVLTATQMNNLQANDYNWSTNAQTASYTLVAADAGKTVTMTNAAATTITVNTSLFTAGDTVQILNLGAGVCTVTAGTATVNTAGSLVLPQYGSGTLWFSSASAAIFIPDDRNSGLTLIKSQTVGSGVSSVAVTSVFSATYDNYLVIGSAISINAGAADIKLTLNGSAGSTYQNWGYFTTAGLALTGNGGANLAYQSLGIYSAGLNSFVVQIQNPFATAATQFQAANGNPSYGGIQNGADTNAASSTNFTITIANQMTGGTIRVYGYQNS